MAEQHCVQSRLATLPLSFRQTPTVMSFALLAVDTCLCTSRSACQELSKKHTLLHLFLLRPSRVSHPAASLRLSRRGYKLSQALRHSHLAKNELQLQEALGFIRVLKSWLRACALQLKIYGRPIRCGSKSSARIGLSCPVVFFVFVRVFVFCVLR